jgi:SET domain-containing protein
MLKKTIEITNKVLPRSGEGKIRPDYQNPPPIPRLAVLLLLTLEKSSTGGLRGASGNS